MRWNTTMLVFALATVPVALCAQVSAVESDPAPAAVSDESQLSLPGDLELRLDAAVLQAEDDAAAAYLELTSVIDDPGFGALSNDAQRTAFSTAAWVALLAGELPRSRELHRKAIDADPGDGNDWYRLGLVESDLGNFEESAANLLHVLETWPGALEQLDSDYIARLVFRMEPSSPRRLALMQALFDASWTRDGLGASEIWHQLAVQRIERGHTEAARAAIERITTTEELVSLRVDRRFDQIVNRDDVHFDVARAARERADDLRLKAMLEPERLDLLMEFSYAELGIGHHQEVLAMTDAALALLADEPAADWMFSDTTDQVWLMNNRAIALRRLGRTDEALAQLERASLLSEDGAPNVSQLLNLGQFYCSVDRPADALKAIAAAGAGISDYGRMVQESVRHRAMRAMDEKAGAEAAMEYLREHRNDSQRIWLRALIEEDRLDEAASALVSLLDIPDERAEALLWVQEFRRAPTLPGDAAFTERRGALIARADVQAAVNKTGRIERHDVYNTGGVE